MLTSILMRSTPDQVRMILVDPKRVEMGQYDKLPHLLTQVVTDPKKAANALGWAVREMERRYDLLAKSAFRDITGYNAAYDRGDLRPNAELLDADAEEVTDVPPAAVHPRRGRRARRPHDGRRPRRRGVDLPARPDGPGRRHPPGDRHAASVGQRHHRRHQGQRPGPSRLRRVELVTDTRVILDQGGAERLVGKGDMLLLGPASSSPRRIQGSWVTEEEVRKIASHWRSARRPRSTYDDEVQGADDGAPGGRRRLAGGSSGSDDDDDLMAQAMELIVRSQLGSTSMLQRKLKVGFARAGRIMDLLEQRGVVGPSTGSKARDVLMTESELDELLAGADA